MRIALRNTGFSCCYRRLDVSVVLRTAGSGQIRRFAVETDSKSWEPGRRIVLEAAFDCAEWAEGPYLLGLRLFDPTSGKAIALSNSFAAPDHDSVTALGYIRRREGVL